MGFVHRGQLTTDDAYERTMKEIEDEKTHLALDIHSRLVRGRVPYLYNIVTPAAEVRAFMHFQSYA
jgi:hypothetical protein